MRVCTGFLISPNQTATDVCSNGQDLEHVRSYADGLALIKKAHYDWVVVEFCDELAFSDLIKDAKLADATIHIVAALPAQFKTATKKILASGADDVIAFPIEPTEFSVLVKRATAHLTGRDEVRYRRAQSNVLSNEVIGRSEPMLAIFHKLDEVSRSTDPVLISGGPGTGKKLLAWSLHLRSMRRGETYFTVNCSAYPGAMLEHELFGSTRRSSSGGHAGAMTIGDGGTLVLENIDAMALPIQQRLLKIIQATGNSNLNVRVVCLTSKDLDGEANAGRFDRDLLAKLKQRHIPLPALRERTGDVMLVGEYLYRRYCGELGVNPSIPEAGFWEALSVHDWPGNLRELGNTMYRAALLCLEKKTVQLSSVQDQSAPARVAAPEAPVAAAAAIAPDEAVFKVGMTLETIELEMIRRTVEMTKGNRTQAAKILGISVRSLYNKMIEVEKLAGPQPPAEPADAAKGVLVESQCA